MHSGIGGGAFASSMSNISYFFPGRMMGLALGLNGGIGNLGVTPSHLMYIPHRNS
jgi:NNP family nitrate/nitrite transporter-like MFS transporter